MTEVQNTHREYPAPWEGATPEEDAAYNEQVQFGNTEFEADVRHALGPVGSESVDADHADFISGKWNLHGFYVPEGFDEDPEEFEATIERYGKVMEKADATMAGDTAYAVGAHNARPELWAHEFRHRSDAKEGRNYLGSDETAVRKRIAFRATTADQWLRSVELWRDVMLGREKSGAKVSLAEAEAHLKTTLKTAAPTFIDAESRYLDEKGSIPSQRRWRIDSHRADSREAYERRQKSWNIKDAVRHKQMVARKAAEEGRRQDLDKALDDLQEKINFINDELDKKRGPLGE